MTSPLNERHPVGLVGANGYSGRELARLLLHHPLTELKACFTRDPHWNLDKELGGGSECGGVSHLPLDTLIEAARNFKVVFLATPVEVSLKLVPLLISQTKIIDLSGAFRLSANEFEKFYHMKHESEELASHARYGLIPWSQSTNGSLISNPGCYATSCLMALIPLLKDKLIDPLNIVIDAKSGTTGAGRKANESLLFSEVDGNCLPYKIGIHQHLPEIKKYADLYSETNCDIQMTTHLLPTRRGIISSLYLKRHQKLSKNDDENFLNLISKSYEKSYSGETLVRFGNFNDCPELLSLRNVVGSARTHISYGVIGQKIFVFSCLDNLLKGAATQAIENWNAQNAWPTDLGLSHLEGSL